MASACVTKVTCKGLRVSVLPKFMYVDVPCKGLHHDIREMFINNTGPDRLTYKLIPTKDHRFSIDKKTGFVEAGEKVQIDVQVTEFQQSDGVHPNDRITVLLANAPQGVDDSDLIWADKSPHQPKDQQKHEVLVDYVFLDDKKKKRS